MTRWPDSGRWPWRVNSPTARGHLTTQVPRYPQPLVLRQEKGYLMTNNTITAPRGFLAAGIRCWDQEIGQAGSGPASSVPTGAPAAAVFTTNQITSAAVQISTEHVGSRRVVAVVVNSGNANACTGRRGLADAVQMCRLTAEPIQADPHQVLVASTGFGPNIKNSQGGIKK